MHPIALCTHRGECMPRNVDRVFWSSESTMPIFPLSRCSWETVPEVYGDTRATTTPGRFAAGAKNRSSASGVWPSTYIPEVRVI